MWWFFYIRTFVSSGYPEHLLHKIMHAQSYVSPERSFLGPGIMVQWVKLHPAIHIRALASVLALPVLMKLAGFIRMCPGRKQKMAQIPGSFVSHVGDPGGVLISSPIPGCCGHLRREQSDERCLSLCVILYYKSIFTMKSIRCEGLEMKTNHSRGYP